MYLYSNIVPVKPLCCIWINCYMSNSSTIPFTPKFVSYNPTCFDIKFSISKSRFNLTFVFFQSDIAELWNMLKIFIKCTFLSMYDSQRIKRFKKINKPIVLRLTKAVRFIFGWHLMMMWFFVTLSLQQTLWHKCVNILT